jgi:hypothetical protein
MSGGTDSTLRQTGELFEEAGRRLSVVDPGPTAFGAGGLGVLGEVGHEAYLRWQTALDARSREATAHATRLHEVAVVVARAVAALGDADRDAQRGVR